VRGMEYLQTHPGEDEETAWRRLRPKLSLTGRHLDDVFVMLPSAVHATGGSTVPTTPPPGGGLFGGGGTAPTVLPTYGDDTTTGAPPAPKPSGTFGGDNSVPKTRTSLSNTATSPLNLIGKLEGWGVGPASTVHGVRLTAVGGANSRLVEALRVIGEDTSEVIIKVSSATGAQIKELLKKLPDGMTFELNLEKEGD
jgi:hypothetical protein